MKRFAEYLRFSSSPQDKLSSPEAHQRENRAYVERAGGVIVATYHDIIGELGTITSWLIVGGGSVMR